LIFHLKYLFLLNILYDLIRDMTNAKLLTVYLKNTDDANSKNKDLMSFIKANTFNIVKAGYTIEIVALKQKDISNRKTTLVSLGVKEMPAMTSPNNVYLGVNSIKNVISQLGQQNQPSPTNQARRRRGGNDTEVVHDFMMSAIREDESNTPNDDETRRYKMEQAIRKREQHGMDNKDQIRAPRAVAQTQSAQRRGMQNPRSTIDYTQPLQFRFDAVQGEIPIADLAAADGSEDSILMSKYFDANTASNS
jgi:hypothetical protein